MRTYPFAVMDENQPNDLRTSPRSVHDTREAAIGLAAILNRSNPNNHFRAVVWNASANARDFFNDCPSADPAEEEQKHATGCRN